MQVVQANIEPIKDPQRCLLLSEQQQQQQQQQQQHGASDVVRGAASAAAAAAHADFLDERLGRFIESLRHLNAGAFLPPSPAHSDCGGGAGGAGCDASTVSISPSDSASCCYRAQRPATSLARAAAEDDWVDDEDENEGGPDAGAWITGLCADGGGPADAARPAPDSQSALERTLARQLRQLQLARKAAMAAAAYAERGGSARRPAPGSLEAGAAVAGWDALLHCSPSSAASCSNPRPDAAACGIRPTALHFGSTPPGAAARRDAPPRAARAPRRGDAGGGGGEPGGKPRSAAAPPPGRRGVFVGNLPGAVTERALMALFSRCGPIDSLWIARDPRNQVSLGYGYVVYSASDPLAHVRAARSLDGAKLDRQTVRVRPSDRDFGSRGPQGPAAAAAAAHARAAPLGPVAARRQAANA